MCNRLINVLIVIIVLNSVTNVAKSNDNVKVQSSELKQNTSETIFTEAGETSKSTLSTKHTLSRGKSRGLEELSKNSTTTLIANSTVISNSTTTNITDIVASTTTLKPIIVTMKSQNNTISIKNDTVSSSSTTVSSTTTTTTTTTKKPKPKKPTFTKSADEDPAILDNEKKIKFSSTKLDQSTPKLSYDIDRTIENEKRARHSYALFMGVAFGLPMTFVLIHIVYKKIKAYLEVRHYQRVVSRCLLS